MLNKKYIIDIARETLNHQETEILCSDFTDWCEGASAIIWYIVSNYTNEKEVHIISGAFDGKGHEWVEIGGEIYDATVDQFADDYSIYSSSLYKDLYAANSEDFQPQMFDDWVTYIDNLLLNKNADYLYIKNNINERSNT